VGALFVIRKSCHAVIVHVVGVERDGISVACCVGAVGRCGPESGFFFGQVLCVSTWWTYQNFDRLKSSCDQRLGRENHGGCETGIYGFPQIEMRKHSNTLSSEDSERLQTVRDCIFSRLVPTSFSHARNLCSPLRPIPRRVPHSDFSLTVQERDQRDG
jgi:hypothetical protein